MPLIKDTQDRISKALHSGKLDINLRKDLSDILLKGDEERLQKKVSYTMQSNFPISFPRRMLISLSDNFYLVQTTYEQLLELAKDEDIAFFEKNLR